MTATILDNDTELSIWFDMEFEQACEIPETDCSNKAEWKLSMSCCNTTLLICTPHKEYEEKIYKNNTNLGYIIVCKLCWKRGGALNFYRI